jgi:hypothetical protein
VADGGQRATGSSVVDEAWRMQQQQCEQQITAQRAEDKRRRGRETAKADGIGWKREDGRDGEFRERPERAKV